VTGRPNRPPAAIMAGMDAARPWRSYLRLYRPFAGPALLSLGCTFLRSCTPLLMALLIRRLFIDLLHDTSPARLLEIVLALVAIVLGASALSIVSRHFVLKITRSVDCDLRLALSEQAYRIQSATALADDRSGFHFAIMHDAEHVYAMAVAVLTDLLPAFLTISLLLAYITHLNTDLVLIMSAVLLPLAIVNRLIGGRQHRHAEILRSTAEHFDRDVGFAFRMFNLISIRGARGATLRNLAAQANLYYGADTRLQSLQHVYTIVQRAIPTLASLIAVFVGGLEVVKGRMLLADLAAFYFVMNQFNNSLGNAWNGAPNVARGRPALKKIVRLLTLPIPPAYHGAEPVMLRGDIELQSVHFAYGERLVARDLTLRLRPGHVTAIIGPNGVGKTTLAYLVLGLIAPDRGRLCADGHPYDRLDMEMLRRQIGFVAQDAMLFGGTIRDNVTFGRPDVTPAEVAKALRLSTADSVVATLPDAEMTLIGDGGVALSGGQAQRIAIARALLGDPRVLILDEPTNHLDADSVARLLDTIAILDPAPAIMLISHDAAIAGLADDLYELRDGSLHACRPGDAKIRPVQTQSAS
jgi:ABC-type multidrug transport system fused ATPase/permease subunit